MVPVQRKKRDSCSPCNVRDGTEDHQGMMIDVIKYPSGVNTLHVKFIINLRMLLGNVIACLGGNLTNTILSSLS